jgi:nucleolar protein 9
MKKELVEALSTEWVKLATSACGSHVLQACYGAAEQRGRENIVAALARSEAQIAATRHGPFLLRRLGVTQFKSDADQWRNRTKVAEEVKADFARTFGGAEEEDEHVDDEDAEEPVGEKRKKSKGGEDEGDDAEEAEPKRAKKEKKEKKEKKPKRSKE